MLLLLVSAALLGMEAFSIYDSVRTVDAALLDAQLRLSADGGLSPAVERLVRRRVIQDGGDPSRLRLTGTPPGQPYGSQVELTLTYERPYSLPIPGGWRTGIFRVQRTAVMLSGWRP